MADTDRDAWRWRAMIMQPDPVDADLVAAAVAQARERKPSAGLERLRYVRWSEGRCGQLLHVGPYAEEGPSIERLGQHLARLKAYGATTRSASATHDAARRPAHHPSPTGPTKQPGA